MDISNNLKQLRFMKTPAPSKQAKRETLGTWILREMGKQGTKSPHKKECIKDI
ncbi:hypothetical protein NEDG_01824 [Nematocida displodere]|uniref:Uncharacterized protein n=1 Tax=Nematocida displodere TaxID=1805483 RepID=A0A177EHZ7_9MICR|nr:hypothetical protein NEDG_01824 [Nematocida displodere]